MTQRFRKLSHSLYECKYHIVFCPKYRYRIFKEVIGEKVRQLVYQLCKQKEQVEVLELNVQPDHVHLRDVSMNAPSRRIIPKPPPLAAVVYFLLTLGFAYFQFMAPAK